MALITCPECKKKVSDTAAACPHCGFQLTAAKVSEIKSKEQQAQKTVAIGCVAVVASFFILYLISSSSSDTGGRNRSTRARGASTAPGQTATENTQGHPATARQPLTQPHSPDSLEMMAAVFVGSPSRALIKAQMDRALELYGLPIDDENYNRYGSVLVRMRKESGVQEMEMLRFVIALREESPAVNIKLSETIALAATSLELSK